MEINDSKRNVCPDSYSRTETTKKLVCSFVKLLEAEKRCHRKVGYKNSVARFDLNLLTRTYNLQQELINETYKPKEGEVFEIFEPKHRYVTSTRYKDRIPQASFSVNFMYPVIISSHIKNNCACVKNKGVQFARNNFKEMLRNSSLDEFCLKSDFKEYFASINHQILFNELGEYMPEIWPRMFFQDVINVNNQSIGIGLGSEINQLSAMSLFNKLDHMLGDKRYIRYMDDILFIGSKQECIDALQTIKSEACRLGITVSQKKTYIQPVSKPIKFLGFTFLLHPTHRVTLKRIKSKLNNEKRKLRRMKHKGVPIERVLEHYQSVRAGMKKGTRSGVVKLDKYVNNLFKEELSNAIKH